LGWFSTEVVLASWTNLILALEVGDLYRSQALDGSQAVQVSVTGLLDHTHPALPKLCQDLKVRDCLVDHDSIHTVSQKHPPNGRIPAFVGVRELAFNLIRPSKRPACYHSCPLPPKWFPLSKLLGHLFTVPSCFPCTLSGRFYSGRRQPAGGHQNGSKLPHSKMAYSQFQITPNNHCLLARRDVQFTTRVRGAFCALAVLITNFFPSGVTS
jgi:hypothetical protein